MDPLIRTQTRSLSSRLEAGAGLPRRVRIHRDTVLASCPSQGVVLPSLPMTHAVTEKTEPPIDTADRTSKCPRAGQVTANPERRMRSVARAPDRPPDSSEVAAIPRA